MRVEKPAAGQLSKLVYHACSLIFYTPISRGLCQQAEPMISFHVELTQSVFKGRYPEKMFEHVFTKIALVNVLSIDTCLKDWRIKCEARKREGHLSEQNYRAYFGDQL